MIITWDDKTTDLLKLEPSEVMKDKSQSSNCIFNGQLQNRVSSAAVVGCPKSNTLKVVLNCKEVKGSYFGVENGEVIEIESHIHSLSNVTDYLVPSRSKPFNPIRNRRHHIISGYHM